MRTSMTFASLLLLLLAATAHGIRLDRQFQEAINNKQKTAPSGEASIARSVNKRCSSDEHCTSSGTATKPLTDAGSKKMQSSTGNGHTSTTVVDATTAQGRHDAVAPRPSHGSDYQETAAATPREPWQRQTPTTYRDIMDIAGMDYSPATRRSPIHN